MRYAGLFRQPPRFAVDSEHLFPVGPSDSASLPPGVTIDGRPGPYLFGILYSTPLCYLRPLFWVFFSPGVRAFFQVPLVCFSPCARDLLPARRTVVPLSRLLGSFRMLNRPLPGTRRRTPPAIRTHPGRAFGFIELALRKQTLASGAPIKTLFGARLTPCFSGQRRPLRGV